MSAGLTSEMLHVAIGHMLLMPGWHRHYAGRRGSVNALQDARRARARVFVRSGARTRLGDNMKKLAGKVAVITGGSSGIGLAAAKRFVEEGAFVYITGRRASELEKAAASIERNVATVPGDIANLSDIDRLYAKVKADGRRLDVLVANAAFVEMKTLADVTPEHFDKTFNVNARGTFFTVQRALPLLNDGAAIVLVSSSGHLKAPPVYTTYAATKAAQRSFVRTWAAELRTRGIRVNSVSPGPIDTPIFEVQTGDRVSADALRVAFAHAVPMGRIGTADEIASALLFLASSDSSFSTGSDIVADGGISQVMVGG